MVSFKGQFTSIVFIGRQNPQILNHDFLLSHGVLPKDKEPFKKLFAKQDSQPFTEFISTPIITSIKYGSISLVVEENRYQIIDNRFDDPPSSPIIQITKKYFGELLQYTPLQLGGINLNGTIQFTNVEDEQVFDKRLGITREILCNMTDVKDIRISIVFSFPWNNGMVDVQLPKSKDRSEPGGINFNYEFKYQDMDSFLRNLDNFGQVYSKFNNLLQSLGVERVP